MMFFLGSDRAQCRECQTGHYPAHQPPLSVHPPPGWEDPHPLDSTGSHPVPEIHLGQRCVELWHCHVGGDVLRGTALLGHDQPRRKSPECGQGLADQPRLKETRSRDSWPCADFPMVEDLVPRLMKLELFKGEGVGRSHPPISKSSACRRG